MSLSISGTAGRYDAYQILRERSSLQNGPSDEPTRSGSSTAPEKPRPSAREGDPSKTKGSGGKPLTDSDRKTVDELKKRDRAVRAHEQAHMAAGGAMIRGGASFQYQSGPDGQQYAVGGEVSIDTSPGRTPAETIARAQTIKAAALAPSDPSGADRAAAANATRMEAEARTEMRSQGSGSPRGAEERGEGPAPEANEASAKQEQGTPQSGRPGHRREAAGWPDPRIMVGISAYQAANMGRSQSTSTGLELLA